MTFWAGRPPACHRAAHVPEACLGALLERASLSLLLLQLGRKNRLHRLGLLTLSSASVLFVKDEVLGHQTGGAEQVPFQLLGIRGRLVQGRKASSPNFGASPPWAKSCSPRSWHPPLPRGLHACTLLHDAQKRGRSTHDLQGGTRRFGLVSRRPFSSGNLVAGLPKLLDQILIQDLVTLIVLVDRLPAASSTPSPNNLTSLLHCLHTSSLARSTVPGPVDSTLRALWIVQDLETAWSRPPPLPRSLR